MDQKRILSMLYFSVLCEVKISKVGKRDTFYEQGLPDLRFFHVAKTRTKTVTAHLPQFLFCVYLSVISIMILLLGTQSKMLEETLTTILLVS